MTDIQLVPMVFPVVGKLYRYKRGGTMLFDYVSNQNSTMRHALSNPLDYSPAPGDIVLCVRLATEESVFGAETRVSFLCGNGVWGTRWVNSDFFQIYELVE